jgi:hypothetical protein
VMKGEYAAGLSYRVATRRNCLIVLTNRPTDVIGAAVMMDKLQGLYLWSRRSAG